MRTFLFFLLFAQVLTAAELSSAEKKEFLGRISDLHKKHPSLQVEFNEEKSSHILKKPIRNSGTLSFEAPDKFRRDLRGKTPSLTICNGRKMWIYYKNFNEVEEYNIGQRQVFDDSLEAITAGFNFSQVEDFYSLKIFNEPDSYRVELSPKKANLRRIIKQLTVWLDESLAVRKTELLLSKNDRLVTTYHNMQRIPLPASTFKFSPPAGANVTHPLGK